ncbi:MAG: sugar ABC transporter permease, partial [bacterium]|nr:sugar ABC transporter permease [bacterium]
MTAVDAPVPEVVPDEWAAPSLSDSEYRWRARRYRFRTVRRAAGFLSPYLIVWGVFLAIPAVWGIFLSFNQGGLIRGDPRVFVGFENWTRTVSDSELRTAVKNTSIYVLIAIAVVFTLAIFLASLLNNYKKGSNFYKVALYFPLLAPPILGAIMWFFMVNFDFGILNLLKRSVLGGEGIRFLGDNPHALLTIVAVEVWRGLGFWVLFYLAGLQSV